MARQQLNRLQPKMVTRLLAERKIGRHADGGGLYLVIGPNGSGRWAFFFRWRVDLWRPGAGRLREMGLGSVHSVSLKRAREKAAEARESVADRRDPIAARRGPAEVPTFGEIADQVLERKAVESRSDASRARNKRALQEYAKSLRPIRVDWVDTEAVLAALRPIWISKAETAHKTRGLIEAVLTTARVMGHRAGDNPAAWKGHLDQLLPRRSKLAQRHHPAMARVKLPAFNAALRERDAMAAKALEFLILTAARAGEVMRAPWEEVDFEGKVWTVPARRMKTGLDHRVPLPVRAIEVLRATGEPRIGAFIFAGERAGRPLSVMAFDKLMERMGEKDGVTTHGFRSTFRDWCGEESTFPRELAEAALSHAVGDATERAYRRGDALEKRRELMEAWTGFCGSDSAAVESAS